MTEFRVRTPFEDSEVERISTCMRGFSRPFSNADAAWIVNEFNTADPIVLIGVWTSITENPDDSSLILQVHALVYKIILERCFGVKPGDEGVGMIPDLSILG